MRILDNNGVEVLKKNEVAEPMSLAGKKVHIKKATRKCARQQLLAPYKLICTSRLAITRFSRQY